MLDPGIRRHAKLVGLHVPDRDRPLYHHHVHLRMCARIRAGSPYDGCACGTYVAERAAYCKHISPWSAGSEQN